MWSQTRSMPGTATRPTPRSSRVTSLRSQAELSCRTYLQIRRHNELVNRQPADVEPGAASTATQLVQDAALHLLQSIQVVEHLRWHVDRDSPRRQRLWIQRVDISHFNPLQRGTPRAGRSRSDVQS